MEYLGFWVSRKLAYFWETIEIDVIVGESKKIIFLIADCILFICCWEKYIKELKYLY